MERRIFAIAEAVSGEDIKKVRKELALTQADFAKLANISKKTVERWESGDKDITGPIVTLLKVLRDNPQIPEELRIPKKIYPMRIWYMNQQDVCTIIDVDERKQKVRIYNYVKDYIFRAFGKEENPTYEQYEEFLESRCFPRSRDKMKIVLKELDLPFYDPLMIIEKTQGKMAEDNFWLRIER